jgi:hypothetical protein
LAEPPVGLALDEHAVDWLCEMISRWVVSGLGPPQRN